MKKTLPRVARTVVTAALSATLAVGVVAMDARPGQDSVRGGTAVAATTTGSGIQSVHRPSPQARQMIAHINAERKKRGLRPYTYNARLGGVALNWSNSMSRTQKLKHNPRLTSQVRSFRWIGENVGYGPNVPTLHQAFMKSPGHRANVLDRDYTQVGVATVTDKSGRVWTTVVFRKP